MLETCEECGTQFAVDLTACPHCGAPLVRSVNAPELATVEETEQPPSPRRPMERVELPATEDDEEV